MATEGDQDLEALFASYVDRLQSGEEIDPEKVIAENPVFGAEIVDYLQEYLAAGSARNGRKEALGTLGDGWPSLI